MRLLFDKVATALITPFDENGVNFLQFFELIDRQISSGMEALVFLGTTGEPSTMTDVEKCEVVRRCVKHVDKRAVCIIGAGYNDTKKAIAFSAFCQNFGADGLLCVSPYYNKCTENGLYKYYHDICSCTSLPVIAYNVPKRTGVDIPISVLERLSYLPNIAGVKEASGNVQKVVDLIARLKGKMPVYCGDDLLIPPFLSLGASGTVSVLSNVCPKEVLLLHELYLEGNLLAFEKLFYSLYPLIKALFMEVNPIPCKKAMEFLGYDVGIPRLPLTEMESQNAEILRGALKELRLVN